MSHEERIAQARERHGKDFAADSRSTFKPRATRLLTEWAADRIASAKQSKVVRPIDSKKRRAA